MRVQTIGCLFMLLAFALAGCSRGAGAKPSKPKESAPVAQAPEEKKPPIKEEDKLPPKKKESQLTRQRDIISYLPYFKGLGLAYEQISIAGKPPQKKEELRDYVGPEMMKLIDEGYVKCIFGVPKQQMTHGAGNTIVAYEVYEDPTGRRLVLMGDGTPKEMNGEEYKKTPKAGEK